MWIESLDCDQNATVLKLTQDIKRNIILPSKLCAVKRLQGATDLIMKAIGGDLVAFFCTIGNFISYRIKKSVDAHARARETTFLWEDVA